MTIATITINSIDYTSYASLAEANAFLAVDANRSAAWSALTDDQKGMKLVQATRRMDMLSWAGTKTGTDDAQANAWPRTGVTYADGTAVSTSEVPQGVEDACCLIAGSIAVDGDQGEKSAAGSNTKRVKAGSAEVEFFRSTEGGPLQDETAMTYIKDFIAPVALVSGSAPGSSSSQAASQFECETHQLSRGYP